MKNLIIGNTSQLSYYFPEDYVRISSRNIDYDSLSNENWDRVFLCFGESRKYITDIKLYDDINFYLTLEIIDKLTPEQIATIQKIQKERVKSEKKK